MDNRKQNKGKKPQYTANIFSHGTASFLFISELQNLTFAILQPLVLQRCIVSHSIFLIQDLRKERSNTFKVNFFVSIYPHLLSTHLLA